MLRLTLTRLICRILKPFNFRGKGYLVHRIAPRHGIHVLHWRGLKLRLDLSDHIQRGIYFEVFDLMETAWIERNLREGMTFVDVGANVGYFSLQHSPKHP